MFYLCQDEWSLLQQTWHAKAAQPGDEEGVVGLRPVTAHHLHRYPCCTNPTETETESEKKLVMTDNSAAYPLLNLRVEHHTFGSQNCCIVQDNNSM